MDKTKLLKLIDELIEKHKSPRPVPIEYSSFLKELKQRIENDPLE